MGTALTANQLAGGCFIGGANREPKEGEANRSREPNYRFGASFISELNWTFIVDSRHAPSLPAAQTYKCLYSLVLILSICRLYLIIKRSLRICAPPTHPPTHCQSSPPFLHGPDWPRGDLPNCWHVLFRCSVIKFFYYPEGDKAPVYPVARLPEKGTCYWGGTPQAPSVLRARVGPGAGEH